MSILRKIIESTRENLSAVGAAARFVLRSKKLYVENLGGGDYRAVVYSNVPLTNSLSELYDKLGRELDQLKYIVESINEVDEVRADTSGAMDVHYNPKTQRYEHEIRFSKGSFESMKDVAKILSSKLK